LQFVEELGINAPIDFDMLNRPKRTGIGLYGAGTPCVTFCPGGPETGLDDPRGQLLPRAVEHIVTEQPVTCVLENSHRLLSAKLKPFLNILLDALRSGGYVAKAIQVNTHGPYSVIC
jgi:site-specific DNA-cytosine methylase